MMDFLFYLFAALVVVGAMSVAHQRNAVNAALSMIITFLGVFGLLVLLESFFLGILLMLVYAGAIVVLFLFVIMLLDVEKAPRPSILGHVAAGLAGLILLGGVYYLFFSGEAPDFVAEPGAETLSVRIYNFGELLLTRYMLPFQIAGFMLLSAMVGVIVLSRRLDVDKKQSVESPVATGGGNP